MLHFAPSSDQALPITPAKVDTQIHSVTTLLNLKQCTALLIAVRCIGVKPNDNAPSDLLRRVSIDYQQAAAEAFVSATAASGVKMRFVYVSGGLVERDQSKSLWFTDELRKVRVRVSPCFTRIYSLISIDMHLSKGHCPGS